MSARSKKRRARSTMARRSAVPWWILGFAAVALVAAGAWFALRTGPQAAVSGGALPGPLGGSSVAQDVNTLVGKPAPPFTLAGSDGKGYTVTPGQGRPLVLVSHMGIT